MYERAMGAVLGVSPAERQVKLTAELRLLLEALIDLDAAIHGPANKDHVRANKDFCIVAGELALNQSRNSRKTINTRIEKLKLAGFIDFEPFQGGSRLGSKLVVSDEMLLAFKKFRHFKQLIKIVTLVEDDDGGLPEQVKRELNEQVQNNIAELKKAGIYIGYSDAELDRMMLDEVEPKVKEIRKDRRTKKEASRLQIEGRAQ